MWALTPFISAAQGAIAALVVYLILMAGIDEVSKTFPKFVSKEEVAKSDKLMRDEWAEAKEAAIKAGKEPRKPPRPQRNFPAEPASPTDAAKLYVFCFLAGFSERLVPDVLSQLATKAKARGSSEP